MDVTMTYQTQEWWTWWLALYLYFGGMGAAVLVVAFLTDMYIKPYPRLVLWGALSGIAMLSIGSLMLFGHLLDHLAVIHVLNPLVLFKKPDAWIAWGTQFIVWMMIWGFLYALPHIKDTQIAHRLPVVKDLWEWRIFKWLTHCCGRYSRFIGWMATINGIGTAVYTGLLLQSFPAVALWHNPGVPLLFTVSAFSTALAFLLIVLNLFNLRDEDKALRHFYERLDLMLISGELVILFSFYHYMKSGSESAAHSWALLWNDMGWLIGFIGFGLLVPFVLELRGVLKGWASRVPIVTASLLVLAGGYLLRHYFMYSGVYAFPW
jgi:polysulfide reductase chain C